jgi:hypothetical protein
MQRLLHRRKWKFDDFVNSPVSGVALHFEASAAQEQRAACGSMCAPILNRLLNFLYSDTYDIIKREI